MMASCPQSGAFLPLLDTLEDAMAPPSEQTDAYLTIANRLSGDEGRVFLPAVEKHFPRLGTSILGHVHSVCPELGQSALQALGFCVFHAHLASALSEEFAGEILSCLCSLVVKSSDKNTCTRALWVISKQSFTPDVVSAKVPVILGTLQSVWSREDVQSVVMEHEALNVVIRLLEQVPVQMEQGAGQWAGLVLPLVVHSASKVRLRAAAAFELGLPRLLRRQAEVAAIVEPMMSAKLVPELQKLFVSKNETNVLKLWPLLVKLLGKLLHRGGPFINSLLHLEELGFRSSSPSIKKISFIAWKSLIDNFALNPDILCSSKRMKLLLQPLLSIQVRTEVLLLTKVEVWWYLVVTLGQNLPAHFDQVCVPLLQTTISSDSGVPGTPSRSLPSVNGGATPTTPKTGPAPSFPSIQLLGLEMLLHLLLGPDVTSSAARSQLYLGLEPLNHPLLSGPPSFTKHAAVLVTHIRDGFINVGPQAPDSLLSLIWTSLVRFVHLTIDAGGSKKERQGCEVITLMLQALQRIVSSEALPAGRVLVLFEATVKGIPPRILGSASYQVGKMDVFNGTPALFLLLLFFNSSTLPAFLEEERFFLCLQTLIGCGLSGPASPLAFAEAVLSAIGRRASSLPNKEQVWRTWSALVGPLTDTITQSNEVNQGDVLDHNFGCVLSALMLPVSHLLTEAELSEASHRAMLSSWSRLYQVFARCSSLVPTAEENVCCEQLSAKMLASVDQQALRRPGAAISLSVMLQVMGECVDFSPFSPHHQHKPKSPHTPSHWTRRRSRSLGNLSSFLQLLLQSLDLHLLLPHAASQSTGSALVSVLSALFSNLAVADAVREALVALVQPLSLLYGQDDPQLDHGKLEKLLSDLLGCLQSRCSLAFDGELLALLCPLLAVLFPHRHRAFRTAVGHFWNATFANTLTLTYPEELRPILSQVKSTTPILLPGFQAVELPEDLHTHTTSDSSQMETRVSGISVVSLGGKELEPKNWGISVAPKPVSVKLDFGSPKAPPRRELEDEASVDFVFIPPENKERVLTEHQKEVKRTKRVDIPVMYNNLDASLDCTGFPQQSQEDSTDQLTGESGPASGEAPAEVPPAEVEFLTNEFQDGPSPKKPNEEVVPPHSTDVSMEEEIRTKDVNQHLDTESKEESSPNVSTSSDLVSGTPQKPNSRRQSFITLEKYPEGKSPGPAGGSTFTGPLVKTSSSNKHSVNEKSDVSPTPARPDSQDSQSRLDTSQRDLLPESPRRPKVSRTRTGPVKLTERLSSDTTEDEDLIPDTQTEGETKGGPRITSMLEGVQSSSQEEDSEAWLDMSQSVLDEVSQDEPRKSGRSRVRPQIPGEDPNDRESKYNLTKKRRSRELVPSEAQGPSPANTRPNTRSKQAEEESNSRLRTRSQGSIESSQTSSPGRPGRKIKMLRHSEDFLTKPERKRKSVGDQEYNRTDTDSQQETNHKRKSMKKNETSPLKAEVKDSDSERVLPPQSPKRAENHNHASSPPTGNQPQTKETPSLSMNESQDGEIPVDLDLNSPLETTLPDFNQDTQDFTPTDTRSKRPYRRRKSKEPTGSQADPPSSRQERTTRSKAQEETLTSTPKNPQTLEGSGSELSQGKARYSTRRSSQTEPSSMDSSSMDSSSMDSSSKGSSETKGNIGVKRRGRKPRVSLQSPLTFESKEDKRDSIVENDLKTETQRPEEQCETVPQEESQPQDQKNPNAVRVLEDPHQEGCKFTPISEKPIETSGSSLEEVRDEGKSKSEINQDQNQEELPHLFSPAEELEVLESVTGVEVPLQNLKENRQDQQAAPPVQPSTSKVVLLPQETHQDNHAACPVESFTIKGVLPLQEDHQDHQAAPSAEPFTSKGVLPLQEDHQDHQAAPPAEPFTCEGVLPLQEDHQDHQAAPSAEPFTCEGVLPLQEVHQDHQAAPPAEPLTCEGVIPLQEDHQDHQAAPPAEPFTCEGVLPLQEDHQDHQAAPTAEPFTCEEVLPLQEYHQDHQAAPPAEPFTCEGVLPLQEAHQDHQAEGFQEEPQSPDREEGAGELESTATTPSEILCQYSPLKQKDLGNLMAAECGQSPGGGRAKGAWSPSASPSTSILKKGQKRALEEETPSPLLKSRRVSFANPIQHQEVADDIDRRSPAVRTASPRRPKGSQQKLVTTPTKAVLGLSPRSLHSPGFKSSKKCLISEMIGQTGPAPTDCIYPALLGCSAPVEAVLPQISSNMWSRGFGQLVRARNIRTVGDLSALTPADIRALPIRSPKLSNVRKALRTYEQQRKGRGGDELKSLDEMERMASEVEERSAPQVADETLASALDDVSEKRPPQAEGGGVLSELEALSSRMTSNQLALCSPLQLLDVHGELGALQRRVVVELQSRLLAPPPGPAP